MQSEPMQSAYDCSSDTFIFRAIPFVHHQIFGALAVYWYYGHTTILMQGVASRLCISSVYSSVWHVETLSYQDIKWDWTDDQDWPVYSRRTDIQRARLDLGTLSNTTQVPVSSWLFHNLLVKRHSSDFVTAKFREFKNSSSTSITLPKNC